MPKVSVIIPSYNHVQYIRQCVDSVLAQTYQDIEIIVVDDGSTDGTVEILREYDDRIVLIEQTNRGTQAARNAAIRASSGEFIALLDSDDEWLPGKLQRQMPVLVEHPEIGMAYGQAYTIDEQGVRLNSGRAFGAPVSESAFEDILVLNPVPALTAVVRRSCLNDVGLFDESFIGAADWDLWLRIAHRWSIVCVEEPLALYRVHDSNTTKLLYKTRQIYEEHQRVLARAEEIVGLHHATSVAWAIARSQAQMVGTEADVLSNNLDGASEKFAAALSFDPHRPERSDVLLHEIVSWSHEWCGRDKNAKNYRYFVDHLFARAVQVEPKLVQFKRKVLATAAMSTVFAANPETEVAVIRSLLPLGVSNEPNWLRNRGVWSRAFDAYLKETWLQEWSMLARRSVHRSRGTSLNEASQE